MKLDKRFKLFKVSRDLEFHRSAIHQVLATLTREHETEFREKQTTNFNKSSPFLDLYYTMRSAKTYEQMLEGFMMFLGAAFDTTGKTIPSVLLLLAINTREQDKVYAEISSILSTETEELDEEKLSKMTYLDMVIKESLRLLPQGFFFLREATENVELSTCTVPKGASIFIMAKMMHINKEIWGDDVMEFKPERFSEENISKVHPYAYVPFSGGARICPGMKYANLIMKIFLSKFLMKYRVKTELKYEELELQMRPTMKLKQGFMVKTERR